MAKAAEVKTVSGDEEANEFLSVGWDLHTVLRPFVVGGGVPNGQTFVLVKYKGANKRTLRA